MSKKTPWLNIIGIGDSGLDSLTPIARSALDSADIIFGGKRHLKFLGEDTRDLQNWSSPFADSIERMLSYRGKSVAVLATGDPLWYGAGSTLSKAIPSEEIRFYPSPSAYSLAAARMGWAIEDTACLTVHGRKLENINPSITPDAQLLILCHNGDTPAKVADLLNDRGFGDSELTALSHLGGTTEVTCKGKATNWKHIDLPNLTTLAVRCVAGVEAIILPTTPGLPDDAFEHDGKLTKREIRAATLAALSPLPGQYLWDVGAGCGSIAIEWCRATNRATASAVETNQDRLASIRTNALAFGTPDLDIINGHAPDALSALTQPDAIFIGGGLSTDGMVEACWDALSRHGRLVANAVTIEGETRLIQAQESYGGELARFSISRAEAVGSFQGWRPMMPVTQWRVIKT
ncbi:MAG: precorrin-6y C5,15-methyltransferase (decarboxylating) subunit CbiE [Alphaproteobacteria bacterium]|nr:precorrin-6y C5,15-methyltransferase (decarboxylating) subunit CbiE [Alphaproteobacteria bacterium]